MAWWVFVIIGVVALLLIYLVALFNGLVRANNKVKEAFSTMDVYLKKRWDLIPNIVETVKGYAAHEADVLRDVIAARSGAYDKMSDSEKIKANQDLSGILGRLMAVAEAYPELKANENFKDLSRELSKVEEDIANARKYYNAVVRIFNNKVEIFPNVIFAKMFGFSVKPMFEVEAGERENVKVKF